MSAVHERMCTSKKYCIVTDVTFVLGLIIAYQQKKEMAAMNVCDTIKQLNSEKQMHLCMNFMEMEQLKTKQDMRRY